MDDVSIQGTIRIDNRDALGGRLGLTPRERDCASDQQLLLKAYDKWGADCMPHIVGVYAFIIHDVHQHRQFVARDPFGIRPLFYHFDGKRFLFGHAVSDVCDQLGYQPPVNPSWLHHYNNMTIEYLDDTYYQDIYRLTPGHQLIIQGGQLKKTQFWDVSVDASIESLNERDAIECIDDLLHQAVQCRLDTSGNVGCELSGGVDSSSIAAVALQHLGNKPLYTFSHVHADDQRETAQYDDESEPINEIIAELGLTHHVNVTEGGGSFKEALRMNMQCLGMPARCTYPATADGLFEKAKANNVTAMLCGFGGDEAYSSYGGEIKREYFKARQFKKLWPLLQENSKRKLIGPLYSCLWLALLCDFPRLHQWVLRWQHREVCRAFKASFSGGNYLDIRKRFICHSVRERQYRGLNGSNAFYVRSRPEVLALMPKRYGIDYRFPLLDIRLVQACYSLPSHMKQRVGAMRYVAKAVAGRYLKPKAIWDKFGFNAVTVPYFDRRISELRGPGDTSDSPWEESRLINEAQLVMWD